MVLLQRFQTPSQQGGRANAPLHTRMTGPGRRVDGTVGRSPDFAVPCPLSAFPPGYGQWHRGDGADRLQLRAQRRILTGFPILPGPVAPGTIGNMAVSEEAAWLQAGRVFPKWPALREQCEPTLARPVGTGGAQEAIWKDDPR
jgi:hypothetical protein